MCHLIGTRPDGASKVRPVDDMTRSGCNAATAVGEKLEYETLDLLLLAMRATRAGCDDELSM